MISRWLDSAERAQLDWLAHLCEGLLHAGELTQMSSGAPIIYHPGAKKSGSTFWWKYSQVVSWWIFVDIFYFLLAQQHPRCPPFWPEDLPLPPADWPFFSNEEVDWMIKCLLFQSNHHTKKVIWWTIAEIFRFIYLADSFKWHTNEDQRAGSTRNPGALDLMVLLKGPTVILLLWHYTLLFISTNIRNEAAMAALKSL